MIRRIPPRFDWLMLALAFGAVIALAIVSGCAIPVRPVAKIATGPDGLQHFIPDPEQEPSIGAFIPDGLPGILGAMGGVGTVAGGILAWLKAREAARCRRDADEGWDKAVAYAKQLPPESPKETQS